MPKKLLQHPRQLDRVSLSSKQNRVSLIHLFILNIYPELNLPSTKAIYNEPIIKNLSCCKFFTSSICKYGPLLSFISFIWINSS